MKQSVLCVMLLLVALPVLGGCGEQKITPAQAKLIAYGGTYVAAYASVEVDLVKPEDATKIAAVLRSAEPPLSALEDSDELYVHLYPFLEDKIVDIFPNGNLQGYALLVCGQGLRLAEEYLHAHPEFADDREFWVPIAVSALQGTQQGLIDAAERKTQNPTPVAAATPGSETTE